MAGNSPSPEAPRCSAPKQPHDMPHPAQHSNTADERAAVPRKRITIHTDGGCSKNPGGDGAFTAHLACEGYASRIIHGYIPAPTTNNRAEWAAVIEGIRALRAPAEVLIVSDSMICVNAINGVGKKAHKRKNQDLVRLFGMVATPHRVIAKWTPGHSDNAINNLCDETCTRVMREKTNPHPQYSMISEESTGALPL
jgi:ribonuclease HI